jgi:hypothetical protein
MFSTIRALSLGSSIGNISSMRRGKWRGIPAALARNTSGAPSFSK